MVDSVKRVKGKKYKCNKRETVEETKTSKKCTGGWSEVKTRKKKRTNSL